jgi:glutathionylspermidine synthase
MQRKECEIRPDWKSIIEQQGLTYWKTLLPDGTERSYWREGSYYSFTSAQIDQMYEDSVTLFDMFVEAGDYLVDRPDVMEKMGIPAWTHAEIRKSWSRYDDQNNEIEWGSVYGRTDVHYDLATGRIRLYEFNADTPTSILEAALSQWRWKEDVANSADQWNGIYEKLVNAWKRNLAFVEGELGHKPVVYFMCTWDDNLLPELSHLDTDPEADHSTDCYEDIQNVRVLMQACKDAGYETELRYVQEVYLDEDGRFYDGRVAGENKPHLDVVFKLHPWEHIVKEEFGPAIFKDLANVGLRSEDGSEYIGGTLWIEPPYKMLWSNKGILPVLWDLFKDDPEKSQLLIPAYFEGEEPASLKNKIRKPIFGREGASMEVIMDGVTVIKTPGYYGAEGFIVQEYCPPPCFVAKGKNSKDVTTEVPLYPTVGIWYIDGEPTGMGIRESEITIADNLSYFTAHAIED